MRQRRRAHYVEADHARVDDYYLAEGTGLAERFVATPDGGVERVGALDGDGYETWVAGRDPLSGDAQAGCGTDAKAVRFVEVVVNGPKTWSLAAALHPDDRRGVRRGEGPRGGSRSSAGSRSTRRRGSARVGVRCRCRSSESKQ